MDGSLFWFHTVQLFLITFNRVTMALSRTVSEIIYDFYNDPRINVSFYGTWYCSKIIY